MSIRIFYDIDGRISGPVSFIQLQLLASSGMLQPHHRVRRENDENWLPAKTVKGLFDAPAQSTPTSPPRPVTAAPAREAVAEDSEINSTFDFFSDSGATPSDGTAAPLELAEGAAASPAQEGDGELPALKSDDGADEQPPPSRFRPSAPKTTVMKMADINAEAKSTESPRSGQAADPAFPEVIGQAVELLGNDAVRLLDGKMVFRLIRGWLQALAKFTDGTLRATYLRLGSLDAAALEIRPAVRRARGGPYPVLYFVAGNVQIAMTFQGNDKAHRAFLDKVLLAAVGKSPSPK